LLQNTDKTSITFAWVVLRVKVVLVLPMCFGTARALRELQKAACVPSIA